MASARYWHRSLNPKKLIDVGFSSLQVRPAPVARPARCRRSVSPADRLSALGVEGRGSSAPAAAPRRALQPRMTLARTIKLLRLPASPSTPRLRPMEPRDVPGTTALLNAHLAARFSLTQQFSEQEVAHWCDCPRVPLKLKAHIPKT